MIDPQILEQLSAFLPDENLFQPFKATFKMTTGVSIAHPWINGDSIIAYQLMREILGKEFYTLPTKKVLPINEYLILPLKQSYGVYHASISIFDTDDIYLTTVYKRFADQNTSCIKTRKKKIQMGAGFYKNCMLSTPYVPAKEVIFYFNGDMELCKRLLKSLPALGKDRSRGFGTIKSISVEPCNEDQSLMKNSCFMRPIPCKEINGISTHSMMLTHHPPYWSRKDAVMCVFPGSGIILGT